MSQAELLYVDQVRPVPESAQRSVKQHFTELFKRQDFTEVVRQFVFYTPVVQHLICDSCRIAIPTDIISHTLAQAIGEHPLVISDLPRTVFRFDDLFVLGKEESSRRSMTQKLYAVQTEVWEQTITRNRTFTVFDRMTSRFCVLAPHQRIIRSPIGKHEDLRLPVQFFNCYGNRETLYFVDEKVPDISDSPQPEDRPVLAMSPPVREFVAVADMALQELRQQTYSPIEEAVRRAASEMESGQNNARMLAIKQDSDLHEKIAKPLNESEIDARTRREYDEIIQYYRSAFGDV